MSVSSPSSWVRRHLDSVRTLPGVLLRVAPLVLLTTAACDRFGPRICTGEFVYGVRVDVFDAMSGDPVTDGLAGLLVESDYTEDMERLDNHLAGAGERPGLYAVVITAPGFDPWVRTQVLVSEGPCHVSVNDLRADLDPTLPAG